MSPQTTERRSAIESGMPRDGGPDPAGPGTATLLTRAPRGAGNESPLSIRDLTVAYHRKPVLWEVDFDAPESRLIAIIGPNGAGKSTLLKAALNLIPRASGRVTIYGKPYKKQRRLVGYVPQRESVDWDFPVNALDVAAMGLYGRIGWCRPVGRRDREAALAALERVGMADYANRQISQLSGGQQQRVFLARALAQDARIYFMDEPFAGVDAATEKAIVQILRDLREAGKTALIVHHDLQTAPEYFDHALMLNMRVVAQGPMGEVFTPENLQKTYGGRLALLDQAAGAIVRGGPSHT